jgi:hypothetical protein
VRPPKKEATRLSEPERDLKSMFFSERLATMLPIEDVRLCVYLQAGVITSLALEPVVIVSTAAL